jgi:hypothetical protein
MSVVNLKARVNGERPEHDVYIGRTWQDFEGTKWANPFSSFYHTEEECSEKYKTYYYGKPELYENVEELHNKTLACWCAPKKTCHGYFLLEEAKKAHEMNQLKK